MPSSKNTEIKMKNGMPEYWPPLNQKENKMVKYLRNTSFAEEWTKFFLGLKEYPGSNWDQSSSIFKVNRQTYSVKL